MAIKKNFRQRAPFFDVDSVDNSALPGGEQFGVVFVNIPTLRGVKNKPVYVGNNWRAAYREFGGEVPGFPEMTYIRALLEAGVPMVISPAAHYTNPADKNTIVGTKGTARVQVIDTAEVLAAGEIDFSGAFVEGEVVTVTVDTGGGAGNIAQAVVTFSTPTLFTAAKNVTDKINATSATNGGYTAEQISVRATGNVEITAVATGENIEILVDTGSGASAISDIITVSAGETPADVAVLLRNSINSGTLTHGFTAAGTGANVLITAAAATGSDANGYTISNNLGAGNTTTLTQFTGGKEAVKVIAPIGSGAGANAYVLGASSSAAGVLGLTQFANGVTEVASQTGVFVAEEIGQGYNDIVVETTTPASKKVGFVDVIITLPEAELNTSLTVTDVPIQPTSEEIAAVNERMRYVKLSTFVDQIPEGQSGTVSGGTEDHALIVASDYIGNQSAKTGFWSFTNVGGGIKPFVVWNLTGDVLVDDALLVMNENQNESFVVETTFPLQAGQQNHQLWLDYRERTGGFSGVPIDSRAFSFTAGQFKIYNPFDTTKTIVVPGSLGAVAAEAAKNAATTDNAPTVHFSAAQEQYGNLSNLLRIAGEQEYNLKGSGEYDTLYVAGINAIVSIGGKIYFEGNKSGFRDGTKSSSKKNNAQNDIYIKRRLPELLFPYRAKQPDPRVWREMFNAVRPFFRALEEAGAIVPGQVFKEGEAGWLYEGDLNVANYTQCTYNDPVNIEAGLYEILIIYIGLNANESTRLTLQQNSFSSTIAAQA